jgi:hypothetical protein
LLLGPQKEILIVECTLFGHFSPTSMRRMMALARRARNPPEPSSAVSASRLPLFCCSSRKLSASEALFSAEILGRPRFEAKITVRRSAVICCFLLFSQRVGNPKASQSFSPTASRNDITMVHFLSI